LTATALTPYQQRKTLLPPTSWGRDCHTSAFSIRTGWRL